MSNLYLRLGYAPLWDVRSAAVSLRLWGPPSDLFALGMHRIPRKFLLLQNCQSGYEWQRDADTLGCEVLIEGWKWICSA